MTRPRPACLHVAPVLGCRGFWLLAAAGGLLVAAVLGYLLSLHFGRDLSPPELGVRVTGVSASRPGHLVRSSVCNHGGQAAAQVRVEGRLVTAGGEEELSKATLDYAPGGSERKGELFSAADPRAGELRLRATGCAEP